MLVYLLTPPDFFFLPQRCSLASYWLGLSSGFFAHVIFFFTYVEFFYYVERAVTLRILVELSKKTISTLEDIQKTYNVEKMLTERLEVMRENGFVYLKNGLWHPTSKGSLFAKAFILSRHILNLGPEQ